MNDEAEKIVRFCQWLDANGYAVCKSYKDGWCAVFYKQYQEIANEFIKDDNQDWQHMESPFSYEYKNFTIKTYHDKVATKHAAAIVIDGQGMTVYRVAHCISYSMARLLAEQWVDEGCYAKVEVCRCQ